MKLFYKIILGLCVTSSCFSAEISSLEEESSLTSSAQVSHPYVKLGSSFIFHHIGIGSRFSDFEKKRGNDYSVNFGYIPILETGSLYLELDHLTYKTKSSSENSHSYSGMGIDIGIMGSSSQFLYPYLNPKIFLGSQNEKGAFHQFSFNILPIALLIAGTVSKYSPPPEIFFAIGLAGIVDISFGF